MQGSGCRHLFTGGRAGHAGNRCQHYQPSRALQRYQTSYLGGVKPLPQQNKLLFTLVEILFSVPPLWEAAKQKAREKIANRGSSIGVDMAEDVDALKAMVPSWEAELRAVTNTALRYPEYYTQPFHAYDEGNLCWEAAFQVPSAAKLVHAPVMDPANKDMDPEGDAKLRRSYSDKLRQLMRQSGSRPVRDIVDVGCATGLSSLELLRNFPEARVVGLDLSPHFLAVGAVLQWQRSEGERIEFRHAAAEDSGLEAESVDLVSICLVMHELPTAAIQAITKEAFRILRPGGTLGIMEMDPTSEAFMRIFGNPFAYVPFKATEPWLTEYITTDLTGLLGDVGFEKVKRASSTPRHFTLAAVKPQ